jgi:hypothetical protein
MGLLELLRNYVNILKNTASCSLFCCTKYIYETDSPKHVFFIAEALES